MANIEIIMAIEEEFDVKIDDKDAEQMTSIQDIVAGVWELKQKAQQSSEPILKTPVD